MSTIYISGKISGDRNYRTKFMDAEAEMMARGWKVTNPARTDPDMEIRSIMIRDLIGVLTSDAVYALPDWKESAGARLETAMAVYCKIPIYYSLTEVPNLWDRDDLPFADAVPPGEAAYDFWSDDTD